jgi:hypothetical protein
MTRRESRHRILALSLALTFAVFNVGIPVVLDACPMPKAVGSMNCAMCQEANMPKGGSPELRSPSCCAPKIVAEGNSNEFLQSANTHTAVKAPVQEFFSPVAAPGVVSPLISNCLAPDGIPPLISPDLPVLHSALLI